jgi:ubiquinone/menaquinone biosynthesis C-methylase UbiE
MKQAKYQPDDKDEAVKLYYEKIASEYDNLRFNNSYGRCIDFQEREILNQWLVSSENKSVLDLACGTGRFLNLATAGLDISPNMLEVARSKHPDKELILASADNIPVASGNYDVVFSLHLFMHLSKDKIGEIFEECYRILRPQGMLIFDIPSALRRKMISYKAADWHGATALSISEINNLCGFKWIFKELVGVTFFPIHRLPAKSRHLLLPLDKLACRSFLKIMSSYYLVKLIKI